MNFSVFKTAVQRQFLKMTKAGTLFRANVSGDKLWETYLGAFPAGTNPLYRERTEHDCSCCRHFIKSIGGVLSIIDGKLVSVWDLTVGEDYQPVADALAELVKSCEISNIFLSTESTIGVDKNFEEGSETANPITWEHFCLRLPAEAIANKTKIGPRLSETQANYDVSLRSLKEITLESVNIVLELIGQNGLYRGTESKAVLTEFRALKVAFDKLTSDTARSLFCWPVASTSHTALARIRNTSLGTLLTDLSEGKDVDEAVSSYEVKVAPSNYRRSTSAVTKSMVEGARKKIEELGLTPSLERRYAVIDDLKITDILYVDRAVRKKLDADVFDEIPLKASTSKKSDKIEEIGIEEFLAKVLPKATSLEVMVENSHVNNLVSLIAPCNLTAKRLFSWDNLFSWSYNGDLTDSLKERVKAAGGRVDGDFRCSLRWYNYDDLDLHMREPTGREIYYANKESPLGGTLDVDMNAGSGHTRTPVENIIYVDRKKMKAGTYTLSVHNFRKRENEDFGFEVEIEFDGIIHSFAYTKAVQDHETVVVAEISYSAKDGFKIVKSLPSSVATKEVWGIKTQSYIPVSAVMLSPNYWGDPARGVGNKHYFFMLGGCVNGGVARGFYNEFLVSDLIPHRKVLEIVGAKMKTAASAEQLSGVGFSSTQRNHLFCRVKGSFTRTMKVIF